MTYDRGCLCLDIFYCLGLYDPSKAKKIYLLESKSDGLDKDDTTADYNVRSPNIELEVVHILRRTSLQVHQDESQCCGRG